MNKYISVAGLYIRMTLLPMVLVQLLFMVIFAIEEQTGFIQALYFCFALFSHGQYNYLIIITLTLFVAVTVILFNGFRNGHSNTEYLMDRLDICDSGAMVAVGLAAFAEYLISWLVWRGFLLIFYYLHYSNDMQKIGLKSILVKLQQDELLRAVVPYFNSVYFVLDIFLLILLAIGAGIISEYRIHKYSAWGIIPGVFTVFILRGYYTKQPGLDIKFVLAPLPLVAMDVILLLNYQKRRKDDEGAF